MDKRSGKAKKEKTTKESCLCFCLAPMVNLKEMHLLFTLISKGEKEICAHKLPHDNDAALAMSEAILTSKVIVTDEDYVKYLRYFPLRREATVSFSSGMPAVHLSSSRQRGTNIPVPTDI